MEDKHRLDDVKENNNDSKQDGINEENENQDTEKLDKKGEECGEPNDKLEKAKTDIEIEMKQMNADVEDEETSNAGSFCRYFADHLSFHSILLLRFSLQNYFSLHPYFQQYYY
jgi:hypothetical protein